MKRKLSSVFTIMLLLSLVLSACAPSASNSGSPSGQGATQPTQGAAQPGAQAPAGTKAAAPAAAAGGQQVNLRVTWWGSQARNDVTIKAIELFQKEHPNIKLTYEFAAWADYWTKLTTQAAGGNLPDIVQHDYAYISEWTNKNLLLPLDDYVKDGTINTKDVNEAALEGGRVNGKLYGVNLGNNSQAIVVDVDAFQKAGVELPRPDWTWADFEKTANTLHEKLGIYGVGEGMSNDQWFKNVYVSEGSSFYKPDGTGLGFTDDKPLVDFLALYTRLLKSGATISRQDELAQTWTPENSLLAQGKAAMAYTNSNQLVAMWQAAGDNRDLKMVPLPRSKNPTNYFKPSQFFSIAANSKHPKEAAMFIDFITNSIPANEILMAERGVPVAGPVRDALAPKMGKSQGEMFRFIKDLEGNTSPIPAPDPAGHPDIVKNVWAPMVVDPLAYGQATPEKAVQVMKAETETILSKNKK